MTFEKNCKKFWINKIIKWKPLHSDYQLQKYEQQTTKCVVLKVVDEIVVNFQVTHVCLLKCL